MKMAWRTNDNENSNNNDDDHRFIRHPNVSTKMHDACTCVGETLRDSKVNPTQKQNHTLITTLATTTTMWKMQKESEKTDGEKESLTNANTKTFMVIMTRKTNINSQ